MLRDLMKKMAVDFKLLEGEGGTNTNVPNAADESALINKLDRSVKFDEIDTVTFGLETDDGKIVKVYVNAEQAEPFEKALSLKLGKIDDIEEVLNAMSKEYEIVDVEWPDEAAETKGETEEDDGSSVLDQRVYGPKRGGETVEDQDDDAKFESLNYGEEVTLALLENNSSIESRFTTATQLMVYHAILDLGVPEIALARNAYRPLIIKGIKQVATDIQQNAAVKSALRTFIRRAVDFEKKAEENVEQRKKEHGIGVDEAVAPVSKTSNQTKAKDDMKIKINESQVNWKFTSDNGELNISNDNNMQITLDSEETEKLIKGINNRDAVVVRDTSTEPTVKFVFSPRGSSVLVKLVGVQEGYMLTNKDVEELLKVAVPDRKIQHDDEDEEVK